MGTCMRGDAREPNRGPGTSTTLSTTTTKATTAASNSIAQVDFESDHLNQQGCGRDFKLRQEK